MTQRSVADSPKLRLAASLYSTGIVSFLTALIPILCIALIMSWGTVAVAQQRTGFLTHTFNDEQGAHKYVVYLPSNYNANQRWPVMLFLHGAGERGRDGRLPMTVGLGPIVAARPDGYPFIVVFPQNEDTEGRILPAWNAGSPDAERALKILEEVEKNYAVDTKREVLSGWSMGGYGVWSLAAADPERWHAVVPLSGGGDPASAEKLKSVPIWAFHGDDDSVVPVEASRQMIAAVNAAGGSPKFTEVTGSGHDVWKVAYAYPDLLKWMLDPASAPHAPATLAASDVRTLDTKSQTGMPFEPALEIPNAVGVRIGNQSLKAIGDSVPRLVRPDMLTGTIDDINTSTTAEGRSFSVSFTDLSYNATLSRARVQAYREGRLNIQLGLENANLTIGSTYVNGSGKSASAGPIEIIIGHNRPVWISFDVRPYVKDRRLRLELVAQRFDIPEDNWYVSGPQGVSTRGIGMTSGRVSSGLVDGLYGRKDQIEREVLTVVPGLIEELEKQLVFDDMSELLDNVWPLPVYRPQVRLFPTDASCDEKGVSLVFGISASDVTTGETREPLATVELQGPPARDLSRSEELELMIQPQILEPLTNLLVKREVAHIHVQDIPREPFAELSSYDTLAEAIPDLKRYANDVEIRSELILTRPLNMTMTDPAPAPAAASTEPANNPDDAVAAQAPGEAAATPPTNTVTPTSEIGLQIGVPSLVWQLSLRTDTASPWQKVAVLNFDLSQTTVLGLIEPTHSHRVLKLDWVGDATLQPTGHFVEGYEPSDPQLNVEQLAGWLQTGWKNWTQEGPASESAVPDVDFGFAKLRLNALQHRGRFLAAEFTTPKTRVTNGSNIPLVYEVKGTYTAWGGPYTLEPGKSHVFDGATPLGYRSSTAGANQKFTLPTGCHVEFFSKNPGDSPRLYQARAESPPSTTTANVSR